MLLSFSKDVVKEHHDDAMLWHSRIEGGQQLHPLSFNGPCGGNHAKRGLAQEGSVDQCHLPNDVEGITCLVAKKVYCYAPEQCSSNYATILPHSITNK